MPPGSGKQFSKLGMGTHGYSLSTLEAKKGITRHFRAAWATEGECLKNQEEDRERREGDGNLFHLPLDFRDKVTRGAQCSNFEKDLPHIPSFV